MLAILVVFAAAALLTAHTAQAHCDRLDGPVVQAARRALTESNVNFVLIWVQKEAELEIKHAFDKTVAVRQLSGEAKELADRYFFETLVRVHRAGEGEPYTGLQPAERELGPATPAGDQALKSGNLEPVVELLTEKMEHGLQSHFKEALSRKKFSPNDVEAGRAFVKAYVEYIHYLEKLHAATASVTHSHSGEPITKAVHHGD
ncbi:MAG: DUF6448 family protein [Limisphaerales bacterium]